jgi:Uroporphyrinogen decarboxylase (URO-D)
MAGIVNLEPLGQRLPPQEAALVPIDLRKTTVEELDKLAGDFDPKFAGVELSPTSRQKRPPEDLIASLGFFKPRHAAMWARAKQLADVKVMLHCCGAVRPLLPDLIDAGLDAINPVQISCRGMEAEGLKRDFGKDLTFWGGGCDTQKILPCGTPAEIREHVLQQCESLAPGGGFVFQQVHNILANVPAENIMAMYDAVREYDARARS